MVSDPTSSTSATYMELGAAVVREVAKMVGAAVGGWKVDRQLVVGEPCGGWEGGGPVRVELEVAEAVG